MYLYGSQSLGTAAEAGSYTPRILSKPYTWKRCEDDIALLVFTVFGRYHPYQIQSIAISS